MHPGPAAVALGDRRTRPGGGLHLRTGFQGDMEEQVVRCDRRRVWHRLRVRGSPEPKALGKVHTLMQRFLSLAYFLLYVSLFNGLFTVMETLFLAYNYPAEECTPQHQSSHESRLRAC